MSDFFFNIQSAWAAIVVLFLAIISFAFYLGGLNQRIKGFEGLKDIIEKMRIEFERKFDEIFLRLPPPATAVSLSPLQLTDLGKKISKKLQMSSWLDAHEFLIEDQLIDKEEDFEIFEQCGLYVKNLETSDEDFRRVLSLTAYNHGLKVEQIRIIYQIELRDRIISKRSRLQKQWGWSHGKKAAACKQYNPPIQNQGLSHIFSTKSARSHEFLALFLSDAHANAALGQRPERDGRQ
ncbi:MAG: hypothetical protein OXC17_02255 [Aestuariivita sp.]|nr:hypothetical protein [Aestuariivita sp.]